MKRVLAAKARRAPRRFIPNPAASTAAPTGKPLAGTSDPRLNAALTMLCSLQVTGGATAPAPPAAAR
jgi:hypothetical protein